MTQKTAEHLDYLLLRMQAKATVPTLDQARNRTLFRAIKDEYFAAIDSCVPEAIAREISDAARERRATSVAIHRDTSHPSGYIEVRSKAHAIAYELAIPAMQAIADRYNASTLAEYEAYRLACEQGVAVPPTGKAA
jgi:hypothetical protein